jgi:hypothetical protein
VLRARAAEGEEGFWLQWETDFIGRAAGAQLAASFFFFFAGKLAASFALSVFVLYTVSILIKDKIWIVKGLGV